MLKRILSYIILLCMISGLCLTGASATAVSPTLEKKLTTPGEVFWTSTLHCGIGQQITSMTKIYLANDYMDYSTYYFRLTEQLGVGLIYEADSAKITLETSDGRDLSKYFTLEEEDGCITATCLNLKKISDLTAEQCILLTYNVTLGPRAVLGNPGNVTESYLEYSSNPQWKGTGIGPLGCTAISRATIFTYGLQISKVDVSTQLPVTGVEFIMRNEGGKYLLLREKGTVASWVDDDRMASSLVTDDEGRLKVYGLAPGKYFLEETKTANGYKLLDRALELSLSAELTDRGQVGSLTVTAVGEDESSTADENLGIVDLRVVNTYGPELPPTGGAGTSIFYIIGFLAVFAGCLVYVAKHRARKMAEI